MKSNFICIKKMPVYLLSASFCLGMFSCQDDVRTDGYSTKDVPELHALSAEQKEVIDYTPKNIVIAHRGTEFWAPEESEAAMRWARNIGADYIECDLQKTKDGVILALHDESLLRTTDVEVVYPSRQNDYVSAFTYDELLKLDIGSWFNEANPEQARSSFVGLDILTLDDVLMIAEGYRIKRDAKGKRIVNRDEKGNYVSTQYEPDPYDNGNRPGVYIETKAPYLFAGMEKALCACLKKHGWYDEDASKMKKIAYKNGVPGNVDIANTKARIILQTFSLGGLINMNKEFKRKIPTLFLMYDMTNSTPASYAEKINFAIDNGATAMGPNIDYIKGYPTSLYPWQGDMIRRTGMDIHAWTFNTQEQFLKYTGPWCDPKKEGGADKNYVDGAFTNHADLAVNFYRETLEGYLAKGLNYFRSNAKCGLPDNLHKNTPVKTAQQVLDELHYAK